MSQCWAEPTLQRLLVPLLHFEACSLSLPLKLSLGDSLVSLLGCLCFFFSYFFFFLDESSYQLIPYHQINQTMKSLGLPESKIGPIIHNCSVCTVTDNTALRGWPSKLDGKSPGTRKLLPRLKYLWSFCVCEMLPSENRKSHTNKTGVVFWHGRRETGLSDSIPLIASIRVTAGTSSARILLIDF